MRSLHRPPAQELSWPLDAQEPLRADDLLSIELIKQSNSLLSTKKLVEIRFG